MFRFLQWNLNGVFNNNADLKILINEFYPDIITLQEAHLPHNNTAHPPNNYIGYYHNWCRCIYEKVDRSWYWVQTNSNYYIPPHQNFTPSELSNILNIFNTPIILLGDFSAWNPLWGSPSTNSRGQIIEDLILSHDLIVLNDGLPTHFSTHKAYSDPAIILSSPLSPPSYYIAL